MINYLKRWFSLKKDIKPSTTAQSLHLIYMLAAKVKEEKIKEASLIKAKEIYNRQLPRFYSVAETGSNFARIYNSASNGEQNEFFREPPYLEAFVKLLKEDGFRVVYQVENGYTVYIDVCWDFGHAFLGRKPL